MKQRDNFTFMNVRHNGSAQPVSKEKFTTFLWFPEHSHTQNFNI